MSVICQNCKSKLSCGCQKRTASDGAQVCSSCITSYESNLKILKHPKQSTGEANPTKILFAQATVSKEDYNKLGDL